MSLLISRDYANSGKPLWLGTAGGEITGNLIVDGTIRADGAISAPTLQTLDPSGIVTGQMVPAANGAGGGLNFQGNLFEFGRIGTGNVNTTLTTSVFGANADNLTVGGTVNCLIGPVPTQLITSTKTVNPVAVSPTAPSQFGVDVSLSGISNAEYDVQATGTVFVASGTVDPSDTVVYTFTSGGGLGSMSTTIVPSSVILGGFGVSGTGPLVASGAAANVTMRARVSPNASGTILGANVRAFKPNGGTAVYGATLTLLDVQRVR